MKISTQSLMDAVQLEPSERLVDWEAAENHLGIQVPTDYRDLVD